MNGYIIAAISTACLGVGFYVGNLRGEVQTDTCKTAAAASTAAQSTTVTDALLDQRSQSAAQAATDNKAEAAHDKDLTQIDLTPTRTDPLIVQSGPAGSAVCPSAVPGSKAKTSAGAANPAAGGSQPVGGAGVDRRPEIEALKKKLEIVTADYRRLDAEWPQPPPEKSP